MGRGYTPNDVDTKHDTNYEIMRRMLGQLALGSHRLSSHIICVNFPHSNCE